MDLSANKTVPSSLFSARNTTLFYYTVPENFPTVNQVLGSNVGSNERLHTPLMSLLQVCFLYYCRISELLSLTVSHVVYPDRAVCIGVKNSCSYLIYLPGISSQLDNTEGLKPCTKLFPFTYMQCYRGAKKIGIFLSIPNKKNKKLLHSSRYIFSNGIKKEFGVDVIKDLMRHREVTSQLYYQFSKE